MSGSHPQFGGTSYGGHPAAPVAAAQAEPGRASLRARLDHLPQMTFRQAGIRNPSLPTLLSLFFLLLAFFIVLNSISGHDSAKQREVASSIGQTFGEGVGNADALSAADNGGQAVTGILKGLASYFGSLIPPEKQKLIISTNQLILHLPTELFFQPDANQFSNGQSSNGQSNDAANPSAADILAPHAAAMLRQIGEAVAKRPVAWGCEIDLELASGNPGDGDLRRASQLASILSATPAQRGNELTVSLVKGDPRWMIIAIRLRQPDLPALPAGGAASSQPVPPQSAAPQQAAP